MSNVLPIIPISKAVDKAIHEITEGLKDEQQGLLCRWSKVNKVVLGSWRFGNQVAICGMSGGGKSFFLNMLRKDFADKKLNANFKKKFRQIHFAFEMTASDELIRTASSETKTSYGDLISAYAKLPENKFLEVKTYLETLRELEIDFVEVSGNVQQIYDTIMHYVGLYPDCKFIISLDHGLLADYQGDEGEVTLISKLSKMFLDVRNRVNSLNLLIVQLNSEIEDTKRITIPSLHFPVKRDIHGSKSVYRDADLVVVLHAPEKLGIQTYGRQQYNAQNKIFSHWIKTRKSGMEGIIGFQQDFANGNLIQLENL